MTPEHHQPLPLPRPELLLGDAPIPATLCRQEADQRAFSMVVVFR